MRLHSKLLLSHKPSTISISRISLRTEETRCRQQNLRKGRGSAHEYTNPTATKKWDVTPKLLWRLKVACKKMRVRPKGTNQTSWDWGSSHHTQALDKKHTLTNPPVQWSSHTLCCFGQSKHSPDRQQCRGDLAVWNDTAKQSHLVSYLESFLSSQAVLPPPKFCFAVLSKPLAIKWCVCVCVGRAPVSDSTFKGVVRHSIHDEKLAFCQPNNTCELSVLCYLVEVVSDFSAGGAGTL